MTTERKAIGQKAMVGHPIAQATGIKSWPEDYQTRNAEKILNNGSWKKEISNVSPEFFATKMFVLFEGMYYHACP